MQRHFALLLVVATAAGLLALLQPCADAGRSIAYLPEPMPMRPPADATQVSFVHPQGMRLRWHVSAPGQFDSEPLTCPARHNFAHGGIYPLKVDNIPGHAGLVVYPCLEIAPPLPSTDESIRTNAVPVSFFEDDFARVARGECVTKVVYLPAPNTAVEPLGRGLETVVIDPGAKGVETLVSSRLDAGCDPVVEADRRGTILAIVRISDDYRLWFQPPFMNLGTSATPPSRPANRERPAAGYRR